MRKGAQLQETQECKEITSMPGTFSRGGDYNADKEMPKTQAVGMEYIMCDRHRV